MILALSRQDSVERLSRERVSQTFVGLSRTRHHLAQLLSRSGAMGPERDLIADRPLARQHVR
jgi:hypothetical protein